MAIIKGHSIYEGWHTDSRDFARLPSEHRLRVLTVQIALQLPRLWQSRVHAMVAKLSTWDGDLKAHAYINWLDKYGGAKAADMSETQVRDMAESYAKQGQGRRFGALWRNLKTKALGGLLLVFNELYEFAVQRLGFYTYAKNATVDTINGLIRRIECAAWWRRNLRRMVFAQYEGGCRLLGLIGAGAKTWYCSDRAVIRRKQQNEANAAMMLARELQNEAGKTMTLADIASKTVANKAIRRGELMTRIRGCEEYADAAGLVGVFTTNTCPSRFHAVLSKGGKNPKYDGSTPFQAQAWLCETWARLRAKLDRSGIKVMGFRVAEPHHDGCPHWHMLLWLKPEHVEDFKTEMVKYWLQDAGTERGAASNRVNIKDMIGGQASGYIAKYISKNIDDHQVDNHFDLSNGSIEHYNGSKHIGLEEIKPSHRVEAWAAGYRIRQFQAIGQPPVTVWRELRRVDKAAAAGGSDTLILAWLAVHKTKDKQADWHGYMKAQGGALLKRKDYRLCSHAIDKLTIGRYGSNTQAWACGVADRSLEHGAIPTKRMQWGAAGFALRRVAAPWTRLNNCTPSKPMNPQERLEIEANDIFLASITQKMRLSGQRNEKEWDEYAGT